MLVMGGNQMVQVNGSNVASPVRIVSDQNGGQVHQQQSQQQQQPQQQQTQQNVGQGMILTTAGNGSQTASGQKVVQLIMAQPSGGNPQQARVIGKYISLVPHFIGVYVNVSLNQGCSHINVLSKGALSMSVLPSFKARCLSQC